MDLIATALFLALVSNRLIEAFVAPIKQKFPKADLWWLVYVAWVVGGALSFAAGVNLFATLLPSLNATVGLVLTALVVGGGANLISDLFPTPHTLDLIGSIDPPAPTTETVADLRARR